MSRGRAAVAIAGEFIAFAPIVEVVSFAKTGAASATDGAAAADINIRLSSTSTNGEEFFLYINLYSASK